MVPRLIQLHRIQLWCSLFLLLTGNTLFGQILFRKLKIVTLSWYLVPRLIQICRTQWLMFSFSVFCFRLKIYFLDKFGPNHQNCQFYLKFATKSKLNIQNSMMMFSFSVFDWEHLLWANLVQILKIVSLNWNLVPWLIHIHIIQRWCLLFLFSTSKFYPKNPFGILMLPS